MSKQSIAREIQNVERDIDRAVQDSMSNKRGTGIFNVAVDRAKRKIKEENAVWQGKLLESFAIEVDRHGYGYFARIFNRADYADAQNDGAEFDAPPPPEALLPWVRDHMYVFDTGDPREAADNLSHYLYETGLDGIHFKAVMMEYLETEAEDDLEKKVNAKL